MAEQHGKALVPQIRFAGFTDPWEQRKLGELFVIGGSGGTPSATNASYYGGDIPFLGISDIKNRDITTTAKSITEKGLENSAAWIIPAGSICLAMYASVGKAGINRVSLATSQAFYNMVFEDETLRDFIYTRLEKADTDNEWNPLISTGTQANLNADKVKSFRILLPSSGERRLIAKYFADLDSLITLHQRKYDKLCVLKKSMLDKMFPKGGSLYPEIRFAGFTDPWEQRKLGEELGFLRNNTLSRAELSDSEGTVFDIHYGDVLIKYGSVLDAEKADVPRIANDAVANRQTCDCLQDGDVIIADTAEDSAVGKCTELCNSAGKKVFSGLHTMPLRPMRKYASGYLGHYLNSPAFHDQLLPLMQGIKVISVSRSAIEDMTMSVPSVAEQASIGAFFDRLDSLITLHQRKLELLRNIKKSMLDKMFV